MRKTIGTLVVSVAMVATTLVTANPAAAAIEWGPDPESCEGELQDGLTNVGFETGPVEWDLTRGLAEPLDDSLSMFFHPNEGEHALMLGPGFGGADASTGTEHQLCQEFTVIGDGIEEFAYHLFAISEGEVGMRVRVVDIDTGEVYIDAEEIMPAGTGTTFTHWRPALLDLSAHIGQDVRLTITFATEDLEESLDMAALLLDSAETGAKSLFDVEHFVRSHTVTVTEDPVLDQLHIELDDPSSYIDLYARFDCPPFIVNETGLYLFPSDAFVSLFLAEEEPLLFTKTGEQEEWWESRIEHADGADIEPGVPHPLIAAVTCDIPGDDAGFAFPVVMLIGSITFAEIEPPPPPPVSQVDRDDDDDDDEDVDAGAGDECLGALPAAATERTAEGSIQRFYAALLCRAADDAGLAYWLSQHEQGMSLTAIAAWFAQSPEFKAKYGAPGLVEFLVLLYDHVLDRAPDEAGADYWLGILTSGKASRAHVIRLFTDSAEFIARIRAAQDL